MPNFLKDKEAIALWLIGAMVVITIPLIVTRFTGETSLTFSDIAEYLIFVGEVSVGILVYRLAATSSHKKAIQKVIANEIIESRHSLETCFTTATASYHRFEEARITILIRETAKQIINVGKHIEVSELQHTGFDLNDLLKDLYFMKQQLEKACDIKSVTSQKVKHYTIAKNTKEELDIKLLRLFYKMK